MRRPDSFSNTNSPTTDYPYGSFKDETAAGANDGTPVQRDQMMDAQHPFLLLLQDLGITVNNTPEVATNQQILPAWKQLIFESSVNQTVIDADATLLDSETDNTFILNPNTATQYGLLTATATATGSNKPSKLYRFEHGANQGLVRGYANSGQVFDWYGMADLNYIPMYMPGQFFEYYWNTNKSKWSIWNHNIFMPVGFQRRNNWVNKHMGNGVTYDTKSSGVDFTGMQISFFDATGDTGNACTAVVVFDSGGTGTSGVLYFYNISGGLNIFPNNNTITAIGDGTTCLVNEGTGSNKNIDYNLYHGYGLDQFSYMVKFWYSTDGTWNNSIGIDITASEAGDGSDHGGSLLQVDTNSLILQSANAIGFLPYINNSGSTQFIDNEDIYNNMKIIF
jgi:hypothetical protein